MTSVLCFLLLLAAAHRGLVSFDGVPVPGATVRAVQGDRDFVTVTDLEGVFFFPELGEEPFTIEVEMPGFSKIQQEVIGPTAEFQMNMLPLPEIRAEVVPTPQPEFDPPLSTESGFQRTEVNALTPDGAVPGGQTPSQSGHFANLSQEDLSRRAADGFLINGSVNNAAASPFAQFARIGNSIRGRPVYNGNAGITVDSSGLNARSYSLTGQDTPEPSYNRVTAFFAAGGPLFIPHLIENRNNAPTFYFGYQRIQSRNAETAPGSMPNPMERNGDFSHAVDNFGRPVQIIDPVTRLPFAENRIPQDRISPQARSLLNLFPLPNSNHEGRYNYQASVSDITHQDRLQARLNKSINARNHLSGSIDVQSARSDSTNLFNFLDISRLSGTDAAVQWTMRPTQRFSAAFRYQFSRQSTNATPHFANRLNVSGMAGIAGNNQEAPYWGPPSLVFAGGISTLSDGQHSFNRTQNSAFSYSSYLMRGNHNMTFGADVRRYQANMLSQQDARGTFTFTGFATGSDFADFLLGIPDTGSIAFGNPDKYFRQTLYDGFINDDWRVSGALTINAGLRWEYETPVSEVHGRLANLSISPDFREIEPVTGNGLVKPDRLGIQPRVGFAWRPMAASSLIVRGGYGIYRNTNVYQPIAAQMAQQFPFSKSLSLQNGPANPFSLADGFVGAPGTRQNTFAVDPDFRVGYLQNWQLSLQRDLPAAMQMTIMYLGTKGTRLPQATLPNTFPSGALNPSGYVYLSSNGNSARHAGQVQLRRRLRAGFSALTQYTLSRAFDNAPLMAGVAVPVNQGGSAIAQDWLSLRAERAPSSFDQRHQFGLQAQYTTGMGIRGGTLAGGWKGAVFKGWTSSFQLDVGSGLPLTPVYFAAVRGTGVTGNLRPDATGASVTDAPPGLHLNPAAYRAPSPGQWGNAGRNSITGPSQFSLNSSLSRSFLWHDRYVIDLRIDATNLLNHVTIRSWNTSITSAQFGLPNRANPMRSIQTSLRLGF